MYNNVTSAYKSVEKATISGRELEARVLTDAALKLKACQDNWGADDRDVRLNEALKLNQKIWTIFQTELAADDNPLPRQLRANLLRLSLFVDRRILDTMAFPEREKLTVIININKNIAEGLRGRAVE